MAASKSANASEMGLMAIEDFLRCPPPGIQSQNLSTRSTVTCLSDSISLMIDDFIAISGRRVMFTNSLGRILQAKTMMECAEVKKKLMSNLLIILVAACQSIPVQGKRKKPNKPGKVLRHFVLMINGKNPRIKYKMEQGLNAVLPSVMCENYTVKVDFMDSLVKLTTDTDLTVLDGSQSVTPCWKNTTFSLDYNGDGGCEFAYCLGFSKRKFPIQGQIIHLKNKTAEEKEKVEEFFRAFVPQTSIKSDAAMEQSS
ncbi:uncharacterized protein LOC108709949 [Xenopus laevis]|uniref:Uncharacterized protein LOC108709949 n=2 Tax=Xenopus laevis TaxID=8355 RepID=Q4V7G9_XENLA|nr:uncharacterized protein LOC108709949 [Xenopus laevis]AAH97920.1 Unknown (protein for MGC:115724) [Xenopus laevis]OCT93116.1 hypothetical protein XELAEV_18016183mg [Xenopus laevis]